MDLVLDSEVVQKHGFPEAVVLFLVKLGLKGSTGLKVKDGWVKMSVEDMFTLSQESVGRSTIRAAIAALTRDRLLIKGRPDNTGDHPMDRTCWYRISDNKRKKK